MIRFSRFLKGNCSKTNLKCAQARGLIKRLHKRHYDLVMIVCTDCKGHFISRLSHFSTGSILSHLTSASLLDTVDEIGS